MGTQKNVSDRNFPKDKTHLLGHFLYIYNSGKKKKFFAVAVGRSETDKVE